jgi:multiple sugar transport system ATP-binding protein
MDGALLQVAPPAALYAEPVNLRVAEFVGSPKINVVPGIAATAATVRALDHGGSLVPAVRVAPGAAVTIGIRPEHAVPVPEGQASIGGPVEMVEQLGADALVHVGYGGGTMIVRVPHGAQPEVGGTFGIRVDPARVFVFDTATGARLRG